MSTQNDDDSFCEFEESNYFDLQNYYYIQEILKSEQEFIDEQKFQQQLELKLKCLINYLIETKSKENLKKLLLCLQEKIINKELYDQYIQILSNIRTSSHRIGLKQCKKETFDILLWILFEIDNC